MVQYGPAVEWRYRCFRSVGTSHRRIALVYRYAAGGASWRQTTIHLIPNSIGSYAHMCFMQCHAKRASMYNHRRRNECQCVSCRFNIRSSCRVRAPLDKLKSDAPIEKFTATQCSSDRSPAPIQTGYSALMREGSKISAARNAEPSPRSWQTGRNGWYANVLRPERRPWGVTWQAHDPRTH